MLLLTRNYRYLFFTLILFYFSSCTPSYYKFSKTYKTNIPGDRPDYSNLYYWAAHPGKKDPGDSVPSPLKNEVIDTSVDVFFIHPTTYMQKDFPEGQNNADINDAELNAKTDYTSILYQASVFNSSARIFAPRYRQAHISAFFDMNKEEAAKVFDTAYADIKSAFEYYLQHYNNGRPIIIASHSQGTLHTGRLLKEFFERKALQNQLVIAYLIGMPVSKDYFTQLQPCKDSTSTGCFVSWRTLKKGYVPFYVKKETTPSFVTNPLTWTSDTVYASKQLNKAAILWRFNKLLPQATSAQIHENVLWISKPKIPFGFLVNIKNFHPGDINLFYMNIRQNVKTRIHSYLSSAHQ
ncbi:MAG: DUF3089 domain-containing protein [Sphingobacteriales bacterium]|nr:DUF3089 domain-containing protein [Sphingobacteriales bacterium]MBI3720309.1 DUF3089 domain-containing protein [Sphingobacteriales bacterium]